MKKCFKTLKVCTLETASFSSPLFCGESSSNGRNVAFFKCFLSPKSWPLGAETAEWHPPLASVVGHSRKTPLKRDSATAMAGRGQGQGLLQSSPTQWNPLWESMGARSTSISSQASSRSRRIGQRLFSFGDEKNKLSSPQQLHWEI